jgi:hypothetical protein
VRQRNRDQRLRVNRQRLRELRWRLPERLRRRRVRLRRRQQLPVRPGLQLGHEQLHDQLQRIAAV